MIRRPTPTAQLYAWHREALGNPDLPRHDSFPQCGWYQTKLVKGGPWVAAEIWVEREIDPETGELTAPEVLRCEIDGMRRDPAAIWTHLRPISRADHRALLQRREDIPEMAATMATIDLTRKAMRP